MIHMSMALSIMLGLIDAMSVLTRTLAIAAAAATTTTTLVVAHPPSCCAQAAPPRSHGFHRADAPH